VNITLGDWFILLGILCIVAPVALLVWMSK
jgi:hypothetical protein